MYITKKIIVRRIRFEFSDRDWKVYNQRVVQMTIPVSKKVEKKHTGFWYEIKTEKGEILYSQVINDPNDYIEIPNMDGTFVRLNKRRSKGTFEVIIPEKEEANSIEFYKSYYNEEKRDYVIEKINEFKIEKIDAEKEVE